MKLHMRWVYTHNDGKGTVYKSPKADHLTPFVWQLLGAWGQGANTIMPKEIRPRPR